MIVLGQWSSVIITVMWRINGRLTAPNKQTIIFSISTYKNLFDTYYNSVNVPFLLIVYTIAPENFNKLEKKLFLGSSDKATYIT